MERERQIFMRATLEKEREKMRQYYVHMGERLESVKERKVRERERERGEDTYMRRLEREKEGR